MDPKARYLYRRDDEDYIGPLARYDDGVFYYRRDVGADWRPGGRLGVGFVKPSEASAKSMPKKAPKNSTRTAALKEAIEELRKADGIGSWQEAVAVVEKMIQ